MILLYHEIYCRYELRLFWLFEDSKNKQLQYIQLYSISSYTCMQTLVHIKMTLRNFEAMKIWNSKAASVLRIRRSCKASKLRNVRSSIFYPKTATRSWAAEISQGTEILTVSLRRKSYFKSKFMKWEILWDIVNIWNFCGILSGRNFLKKETSSSWYFFMDRAQKSRIATEHGNVPSALFHEGRIKFFFLKYRRFML